MNTVFKRVLNLSFESYMYLLLKDCNKYTDKYGQ